MVERLGTRIDSKLITCADRDTYFLSPLDGGNLARVQTRVLVSSEIHEISCVNVLRETGSPEFGLHRELSVG
jgi:hypothetical protein